MNGAKSLRALFDTVGRTITSGKSAFTTREEFNARVDICGLCENCQLIKKFGLELGVCKACGCMIHFKAAMTRARCPIHKWPPDI